MEIALAVLLVLSFPIIAIAGLVIALGVRERVRVLEQRFAEIQKSRTAAAAVTAAPERAETPPTPAAEYRATAPTQPSEPDATAIPQDALPRDAIPEPTPAATSVPPSPPPPPSAPDSAEPRMGFEERLGTQWTVWVGGVALALGGFFLVRYSIEQVGSAGMRVLLGACWRSC
jgi:uncharacterized membrane protein